MDRTDNNKKLFGWRMNTMIDRRHYPHLYHRPDSDDCLLSWSHRRDRGSNRDVRSPSLHDYSTAVNYQL